MPYLTIVIMCGLAVGYYRIGQHERVPGLIPAAASVALFLATTQVFGWGLGATMLAQTLVFAGLWARNALTGRNPD